MRTLILYASKYGFTENVSNLLADHIEGDVVVENCGKDYSVDLTKFDNIIIGSSIYVGRPNSAVLDFCENYNRLLMNKKIAFFVTGSVQSDAIKVAKESFPENLIKHARIISYLGYALDFEKMRLFDRVVTRVISKKSVSEITVLSQNIEALASTLNDK